MLKHDNNAAKDFDIQSAWVFYIIIFKFEPFFVQIYEGE